MGEMAQKIREKFLNAHKLLLIHNQLSALIVFRIKNGRFYFSKTRIFCTILFVVLYILLGYFYIGNVAGHRMPFVIKGSQIFTVFCSNFSTVVLMLWNIVQQRPYIHFLTKILEFDEFLLLQKNCNLFNMYKMEQKRLLKSFGRCYIFVVFFIAVYCIYWIWLERFPNILQAIHWSISYYITSAFFFQTTEFAQMIKLRFRVLNHCVNYIKRGLSNPDFARNQAAAYVELTRTCYLHHSLSKIIRAFNANFGFSLLLKFGSNFLYLLLMMFLFSSKVQSRHVDWMFASYSLVISVTAVLDPFYLSMICYATVQEGKRTVELVHDIKTDDVKVLDQIEMFALQVANYKNEFRATGFFTIDNTLIFSFLGGLATYIIILIQLSASIAK